MSAEPEPVSRKRSIAPERLDWVVKRCLAKDPERRWHSARDVAIELDAIAGQATAASDSIAGSGGPAVAADGRAPTMAKSRRCRRIGGHDGCGPRPRALVLGASVWWLASRDREPEPPAAVSAAVGNRVRRCGNGGRSSLPDAERRPRDPPARRRHSSGDVDALGQVGLDATHALLFGRRLGGSLRGSPRASRARSTTAASGAFRARFG